MSHTIALPKLLEIGGGSLAKLPDVLAAIGSTRPYIITDMIMENLGYISRVQALLDNAGIKSNVFNAVVPEPTEASILPAVQAAREGDYDCVIALGGGSAIDSAKAIAILAHFGGVMNDYKVPRIVNEAGLPIIAIPTTAGTGSEATRVTIITDADSDEKMLCMGLGFLPTAAIIDYELTLSAPARVTADTGIDALTHAVEAYVSKKATAYTDLQALAAIKLIAPNLRTAYFDGHNRQAREALMLGATLAGIAFSNASVCLVHGMSRPIGAHFHVPHGLSNAMLLPVVTEYSIPGASERYATCARAMGITETGDSDTVANDKLLKEFRAINDDLKVPSPADFGIDKATYFQLSSLMADQAIASGSPANNPRVPTADEIIELYKEVWQQSEIKGPQ